MMIDRDEDDDEDLELGAVIAEAEGGAGQADIAAACLLLVELRDLVAQRLVHALLS